jgi:hypothetical protein
LGCSESSRSWRPLEKHLRRRVTDNHGFGSIDASVEAIALFFLECVANPTAASPGVLHRFAVVVSKQLKAELSVNEEQQKEDTP